MDDFNWPLIGKLIVIAILAPAWLPVLRELYKEVNESLAEEGGIFGKTPTQDEAQKLAHSRRVRRESLVSVPLGQQNKGAKSSGDGGKRDKGQSGAGAPKRRGF